jgi:dolichol-phosphate mannosyltransferase
VVVTLDADLQNDPADIPAMLDVYVQGVDMVIGWRAKRQDSVIKRYASRFANWVRNKISRETVRDTGCSLKVMRAEMVKRIPMFTGMHRFLPTLMKLEGALVAEVRVNHRPRSKGVSKYGIWDRAWSSAYDLLAVRWMQKRHIGYKVADTNVK